MSDPMKELWVKINKLHCLYIEAEDSPDKLDYETNLGGLIRDFLIIVPHHCKFHFSETLQILKHSILSNPDFRPFKLANAWMAMHKYASNLLSQPWRKEFTSIKLYSGFYKHQIEPVLLRGELMLELIGYQETEPGHLELLEPIDADKVRVVALDSLIAMVECQILRSIYEEVMKVVSSVTWKDIVEARELLGGGPEYISKQLISKLFTTNRHCRSNSYGAACSSTSYPTTIPCNGYGSSMPMHTASYIPPANMNGYYCQHYGHSIPPANLTSGKLIDIDAPVYQRSPPESFSPPSSSIPIPTNTKPRDESWGYVLDTLGKPSTSSNNSKKYSTSNGYTDVDRYNSDSVSQRDRQDRYNGSRISASHTNGEAINIRTGDRYTTSVRDSKTSIGHTVDPISVVHEGLKTLRVEESGNAFDEVDGDLKYRTKENDRYREKCRDEREVRTIERHRRESERERVREREREHRKREFQDREKVLRGSISPDMKYETQLLESKAREEALGHSHESGGHLYAGLRVNLTPESQVNQGLRVNLPEKEVSQGLRVNLSSSGGSAASQSSKTNASQSGHSGAKSNNYSGRSWDCEFCTYRNMEGDICGMCSKSRNSGAELKPLESGGRQCPKCTLVNEKDARVCEACSESLENSATYI